MTLHRRERWDEALSISSQFLVRCRISTSDYLGGGVCLATVVDLASQEVLLPVDVKPAVIEARELYRFYHIGDDETLALRGVSMAVNVGEIVAVVGPSGSGKSTLMACLAGLDEPDGGFVYINGERLTRRDEKSGARIRARMIGLLLQNGNLFDHLTVKQKVQLKMRFAGQRDAARGDEVLELVGISARRNAYPTQLSGGEAARAGLAVALAPRPPVLIADEPTGEVDSETE